MRNKCDFEERCDFHGKAQERKMILKKIFTSGPEEERVRVQDGPEPMESVAASEKVFFLKSICSTLFSA